MEDVKITEDEIKEIDLIICSIDALDEHVQIQIRARGELVLQRKEWWEKMKLLYNLDIVTGTLSLDRHKGIIQIKTPKLNPDDEAVDKVGTK